MSYQGDFAAGDSVHWKFTTRQFTTGIPFTLGGSPVPIVYKDGSLVQSTAGVALTVDFDGVVGLNHVTIDTSADAAFYTDGSQFEVCIMSATVDSVSIEGEVIGRFTLRAQASLYPTVKARTLDVSADGDAEADVTKWLGTAAAAPSVAGVPEVDVTFILGTAAQAASGRFQVDTELIEGVDATDAIAAVVIASAPTTDQIADAVWDEVLTAATHNVASSAGRRLRQIASIATVDSSVNDAAATTTSFVTALTTAVNDFYNDQLLIFTSGTLSGQAKPILDYNGTTKLVTLSEALTSAPANGDTFTIQATHIHPVTQIAAGIWDEATAGHATVATFGKAVTDTLAAVGEVPTNAELDTALAAADDAVLAAVAAVLSDTNDIQTRLPAALTGAGNMKADALALNGDATSAANIAKTTRAIARGTAAAGGTTTSIPTSAFTPAGAAADQFVGRIVTFDADTATTALRGQSTDITASTNAAAPTLTVTALTTAPASGDTFSVT